MKLAIVIALAACAGAPPRSTPGPDAPPTDACVKAFVAREVGEAPRVEIERVPAQGAPFYSVFAVQFGKANDCESGCFFSRGLGVALSCDRIGWFAMKDYDHADRAHTAFRITPGDTLLFDDRLWNQVRVDHFVEWIAKSPGAPPEVRARATAFKRAAP